MPLVFSEMVSRLSAEEQKLLDNTFAKHPELKDDWKNVKEDGLRQADYSRKMNELKSQETKYNEALAYNERMQAWADNALPKFEALEQAGLIDPQTGKEIWTEQKTELEKQLEEARKMAAVGGDVDKAELEKIVQGIVKDAGGKLTQEEVKALYASEGRKLSQEVFDQNWTEKEKTFNEKTIPFVAGFSGANAIIATRYEKETGEEWDAEKQKLLFKRMSDIQNFDPFAVGKEMIEESKTKKKSVSMEEEVKRLREENEALRNNRSMPGSGNEPYLPVPGIKNPLQAMLERSAEPNDVQSLINKGAAEAAKELRAEGKIFGA